MVKKPAKTIRRSEAEPAPPLDFSMDELQGAPAEPPQAVIQAIDQATEQILAGAPTVHLKGETEHQCQVQLVPLFMEKVEAAGFAVVPIAIDGEVPRSF
jgi:hypothetical protein